MTRKRIFLLILAVLTALTLVACGASDDSSVDSSEPQGLQTFGVMVDPSAQPSMGQVINDHPENDPTVPTDVTVDGTDTQTTPPPGQSDNNQTPPSTVPSAAPSTGPSARPSTPPTTTPVEPSPSPSAPSIAPPPPMSSATVDDVMAYVGRPLTDLIEEWGYPSSSDYEYVDDADPSKGEIGTLHFSDFTVTTRRENGTEIITAVTPKPSPTTTIPEISPEASPVE